MTLPEDLVAAPEKNISVIRSQLDLETLDSCETQIETVIQPGLDHATAEK